MKVDKSAYVEPAPTTLPTLLNSLSVAQEQGAINFSNRLNIQGTGLLNLAKVMVEDDECVIDSKSDTEAVCDITTSITPDWYDIKLTDTNGKVETISKGYASGALIIGVPNFQSNNTEPIGFHAYSAKVLDSQLFVVDASIFYRVMSFDTIPTDHTEASTEFIKNSRNATGICKSNNQYIVLDLGSHRARVFNSKPTDKSQVSDFVLGQRTEATATANLEGLSVSSLSNPRGIFCDDDYIIIADSSNNRVLIWNAPITQNFQPADLVIGQADFLQNSVNRGGTVQDNTLSGPYSVHYKNGNLFVTDTGNHRVLVYFGMPVSGAAANRVLGQTLFTVGSSGITQGKLNTPAEVHYGSTHFWVADRGNNRVLGWSLATAMNTWADGRNADLVLGQANFTTNSINKAGPPALDTMNNPMGVTEFGTQLFVSDTNNRRVLVWNTLPTVNNQAAIFVLGQFTSNVGNLFPSLVNSTGTVTSRGGVVSNSGKIYSVEYETGRVLRFPTPTVNQPTADLVIGQPNLYSSFRLPPLGAHTDANLGNPQAIFWDSVDDRLVVPSSGQNRVMIWTIEPTTNGQSANIFLGQPNSTTVSSGTTNNKMFNPVGVCRGGSYLFVADSSNNRILRFTAPFSTGQVADLVLGQINFTSGTANQGGSPTASTLSNPWGLYCDSSRLMVADQGNNRVLIWDGLPSADGEAADIVLGQPDFVTRTAVSPPTASTIASPRDVSLRNNRLVITDATNKRILIWNSIPTVNAAPADQLIGQDNFTTVVSKSECMACISTALMVTFLDDDRIMVNGSNGLGSIQILPLPKID